MKFLLLNLARRKGACVKRFVVSRQLAIDGIQNAPAEHFWPSQLRRSIFDRISFPGRVAVGQAQLPIQQITYRRF